jgi:hypothetical protein
MGKGGDIYQSHTMIQTTVRTYFHLSRTSILPIFINLYGEKTLSQLLGVGCHNIFKTSNEWFLWYRTDYFEVKSLNNISLICDNSVTTQNVWFLRRFFKRFWSAIVFYESKGDTTALQRWVLQTVLRHHTS